MKFHRDIYSELDTRLSQDSKLIQVIVGPRQVGKTTLVKQLFQSKLRLGVYHTADAILSNGAQWLESIYNEAQLMQKQSDLPVVLAIDEIQKISNWSEIIKKLVDQNKFNDDQC